MSWLMGLMAHSLAVFLVAQLLPGVRIRSLFTAVGVALLYGALKFVLWWALVFLSLPLVIISLGLFLVIINAFLLWLTDKLIDGFEVRGFGTTIVASVLISVLDVVLRLVLPGI
jgi:putative membrane protein